MHWAKRTVSEEGAVSYGTVVAMPGAVSVSLEAQGDLSAFYADGVKYYVASSNTGYEGDLEIALVEDDFRIEILQEEMDKNKVLFENANTEAQAFALAFEIDGDQNGTRFWFYNCTATRPSTESSTNEESKEPATDKLTISCAADENGYVRAKTTADTDETVFSKWFDEVYQKTDTDAASNTASTQKSN